MFDEKLYNALNEKFREDSLFYLENEIGLYILIRCNVTRAIYVAISFEDFNRSHILSILDSKIKPSYDATISKEMLKLLYDTIRAYVDRKHKIGEFLKGL